MPSGYEAAAVRANRDRDAQIEMNTLDTLNRHTNHAALATGAANASMEDIITALGGAERKLAGVVINELQSTIASRQHDKQYA